ncbi:MAG: DUF2384 domain-containing protein [Bdellovibrionales bacterium]|nr:DUF2384 domain-containing protein [Bdellovibrionales bacterium]
MTVLDELLFIQREWGLSDPQLADLLHVPLIRLEEARANVGQSPMQPTIPPGLECGIHLISIHRRLCQVFDQKEKRVEWLDTPHSAFGDTRPMAVMLSSADNLAWVAYFLAHASARPSQNREPSQELH